MRPFIVVAAFAAAVASVGFIARAQSTTAPIVLCTSISIANGGLVCNVAPSPSPLPTVTVAPTVAPTVTPTDAPLSVSATAATLVVGRVQTFMITQPGYKAGFSAVSSDPAVASVSVSGSTLTVTPKSPGKAIITVTGNSKSQIKSASTSVEISD